MRLSCPPVAVSPPAKEIRRRGIRRAPSWRQPNQPVWSETLVWNVHANDGFHCRSSRPISGTRLAVSVTVTCNGLCFAADRWGRCTTRSMHGAPRPGPPPQASQKRLANPLWLLPSTLRTARRRFTAESIQCQSSFAGRSPPHGSSSPPCGVIQRNVRPKSDGRRIFTPPAAAKQIDAYGAAAGGSRGAQPKSRNRARLLHRWKRLMPQETGIPAGEPGCSVERGRAAAYVRELQLLLETDGGFGAPACGVGFAQRRDQTSKD
jgi:hypothetical protein